MSRIISYIAAWSDPESVDLHKTLNGQPLLSYVLNIAKNCSLVDEVVVGTAQDNLIELIKNQNSVRHFSTSTPNIDDEGRFGEGIVLDLKTLADEQSWSDDDLIVMLSPYCPMFKAEQVDEAIRWYQETRVSGNQCDVLISVKKIDSHVLSAYVEHNQELMAINPDYEGRWQNRNLPCVYMPSSAIRIFTLQDCIQQGSIPHRHSIPFVMKEEECFEIAEADDMRRCSHLLMDLPDRRRV